jgi:hypothetical protein
VVNNKVYHQRNPGSRVVGEEPNRFVPYFLIQSKTANDEEGEINLMPSVSWSKLFTTNYPSSMPSGTIFFILFGDRYLIEN